MKFLELVAIWFTVVVKQILINFTSRCILCDVYSTHVFTIIHVDTFHVSKADFPVFCTVTLFKIQNRYIAVNLIVVVHSVEDCWASSMKLWVSKKVVLFIVYLSIILTLFILSSLFDNDYTRISYIYIYIYIYIYMMYILYIYIIIYIICIL